MEKTKEKFYYDIEITGILGWVYEMYDSRVHKVEQMPTMLCFSYAHGKKGKIHFESIQNQTEEELVKKLWNFMNEAEVVSAFNAYKFDNRVAFAKFLQYKLPPPAPFKTADPYRVAKRMFRLPSYSMQSIAEYLGIKGKTEITHSSLWYQCLNGDAKAWKLMRLYNNQDVNMLRQEDEALMAWDKSGPNMGDILQIDGICPHCGSKNVTPYGSAPRRNGRVRAFMCADCGGRSNENTIKGGGRLVNA